MRQRLHRSDYIFSGIKTFHELNEAFPSLINPDGSRKPFEQFLNDVRKIDKTYNQHYLRAEYNLAQQSAVMAAKWEQFLEDGDRYNLQYRIANDGRVRPEHAALNRVTLPVSDPFWETYYPPNGWNCRCTVVQVRKGKYPETPHDDAMQRGAAATGNDKRGIFQFNPGKEQKTFPDYNPYTIRRCRDCDIAKATAPDGSPVGNNPHPGLDNNPGIDAKLFSDTHPYIANAYPGAQQAVKRVVRKEENKEIAANLKKIKKQIDQYQGVVVKDEKYITGQIRLLRRSLTDIFEHDREDAVLMTWLCSFDFKDLKGWRYEGWAKNRPYEPNHPKFNPQKPDTPKHPETLYFLYYSKTINGKKYWANVKMHKDYNGEVLYTIEPKAPEDLIKGIPPK